jgi:hypothetical protein
MARRCACGPLGTRTQSLAQGFYRVRRGPTLRPEAEGQDIDGCKHTRRGEVALRVTPLRP